MAQVRQNYNLDWMSALLQWCHAEVEREHRKELRTWPVLQSPATEVYEYNDDYRVFLMRDRGVTSAVPTISSGTAAGPWPKDAPNYEIDVGNFLTALGEFRTYFGLQDQDAVFLLPTILGTSMDDEYDKWATEQQQFMMPLQIKYNVQSQWNYVQGFDVNSGFYLPPGYQFLSDECTRFFADHPKFNQNVFIMTRFDAGNRLLVELDVELRKALRDRGLNPVRADDRMYMADRNLWNNVCVYMLCCQQGVAVLENRIAEEFNPNVALEYGFMRALNRRTLLLADSGFRHLRADIIGTLRETFDITDIAASVAPPVHRWCDEIGFPASEG